MTRRKQDKLSFPQTLIHCKYCSVGTLSAAALYFIYHCCTIHIQISPLGYSLNKSLSSIPQSQAFVVHYVAPVICSVAAYFMFETCFGSESSTAIPTLAPNKATTYQ